MERMKITFWPGMVGRLRQEQIAQQSTWTRIPEGQRIFADMHVIHVVPENGSTTTQVNPTDPGDECYYERTAQISGIPPAGRMRY